MTKEFVEVKPSKVKQFGKGLFATKDIKANSIIAKYKGKLVKPNTPDTEPNNKSIILFNDGTKLYCYQDNPASFANDCVQITNKRRKLLANLKKKKPFYKMHPGTSWNADIMLDDKGNRHKAYLKARTDIKAGEEICCHYSFAYWFNYECFRIGFKIEDEIERNGFPDKIFAYPGFVEYMKLFYPLGKWMVYAKTSTKYIIRIDEPKNQHIFLELLRPSMVLDTLIGMEEDSYKYFVI